MAWNPSPEVQACREFDKEFNRPIVIILSLDDSGNVHLASYGRTKALCSQAKDLGEYLLKAIESW